MNEVKKIYLIIFTCALVTYLSRFLGFYFGEKVKNKNKIFIWMEHVAYAIVFSITFRLIIIPSNDLKEIDLIWRIIIPLMSLVLFLIIKRFLFFFILLSVLLLFLVQTFKINF